MRRRGGRQTTRANHPAETPTQYWRISLYYPFLENLITHLKHVSLNRKTASMRSIYCPVLYDHVATIYKAYQADIYLSLEDFRREVARRQTHWVITNRNDLPTTLKSSSLSFYRYNIMCFVNHASSKRYC
jgi:hypothetical protein